MEVINNKVRSLIFIVNVIFQSFIPVDFPLHKQCIPRFGRAIRFAKIPFRCHGSRLNDDHGVARRSSCRNMNFMGTWIPWSREIGHRLYCCGDVHPGWDISRKLFLLASCPRRGETRAHVGLPVLAFHPRSSRRPNKSFRRGPP